MSHLNQAVLAIVRIVINFRTGSLAGGCMRMRHHAWLATECIHRFGGIMTAQKVALHFLDYLSLVVIIVGIKVLASVHGTFQ